MATVAGEPVSLEEFNARYELRKPKLLLAGGQPSDVAAVLTKVRIADELVDEVLIIAEAQRRGWVLADADLEQALRQLVATYPTPEAFAAFASRFPGGEAGVRRWLRVRRAADALADFVPPDDSAIAAFYDEHRDQYQSPEIAEYSEIVFGPPGSVAASPTLRAKAAEVLSHAQGGDYEFHALAQSHSTGPTAAVGGLRRASAADVGPAAWGVLSRLAPGGVSAIVSLPSGDCILRLEARVAARSRSLPDVADEIRRLLTAGRRLAAVSHLRDRLRASARVEEPLKVRYGEILARATAPIPNTGAVLGGGGARPSKRVEGPSAVPAGVQAEGL